MNAQTKQNGTAVSAWLFACAGLVFIMVIVGAITRLTDSGLSIVEWKPILGVLPPLDDREWERVFELYKHSPEFSKKHFWMDLHDFQVIFFWEWLHRFIGRFIGIAFAVPLAVFWIRNNIPAGYKPKLLGVFLLGGLQGFMGWYMVKSGLIDQPAVSHFRLASHLSLALLIMSILLWLGLSVRNKNGPDDYRNKELYIHGLAVLGAVILTIFWGAFTAGLDAGLIYNDTFPKMGDHWLPSEIWSHQPLWRNFFENPAGVQFVHRWLAMLSVLSILSLWIHAAAKKSNLRLLHALCGMAFIQMGLGIATLFSGVALPVAVAHQSGAVIVLALLIISLHYLRPKK